MFLCTDERIINVAFYTVCGFIILAALGVDIYALLMGLSGLLVSFAFMIGTASSKYLEVRRTGSVFEIVNASCSYNDASVRNSLPHRAFCLSWSVNRTILGTEFVLVNLLLPWTTTVLRVGVGLLKGLIFSLLL